MIIDLSSFLKWMFKFWPMKEKCTLTFPVYLFCLFHDRGNRSAHLYCWSGSLGFGEVLFGTLKVMAYVINKESKLYFFLWLYTIPFPKNLSVYELIYEVLCNYSDVRWRWMASLWQEGLHIGEASFSTRSFMEGGWDSGPNWMRS